MTLTTQVCVPQSEAIVTWNETKNGWQLDNLRGDLEDTRVCLIPWFVAVLLFMLTNPEWSCIHYHRWFHIYIYIHIYMHFFTEYTHIFLEDSLNCCPTVMLSHYPHLWSVLDLRICIFSISESFSIREPRSIPEVAGDSNCVQFPALMAVK